MTRVSNPSIGRGKTSVMMNDGLLLDWEGEVLEEDEEEEDVVVVVLLLHVDVSGRPRHNPMTSSGRPPCLIPFSTPE